MKNIMANFAKITNKFSVKRQRLTLLFAVSLFILLPLVNAEVNNTFIEGEDATLFAQCINSTQGFCENTTNCNLTIFYPNNSLYDENLEMIWHNSSGFYNYTIGVLDVTGTYYGIAYCWDILGVVGSEDFYFNYGVKPEDYNNKWMWFYGISLLLGAGLLILGFMQKDNLVTLLSGFLILAFGIVFISVGYPGLDSQLMNLSIILVSLGLGGYVTVQSGMHLAQEGL